MTGVPQNPGNFAQSNQVAETQANTPVAEICAPCAARYRVEAHYDDPWKTPITLAPLKVQYTDGGIITEGARTRALATYGLQDGQPIQSVRPDVGSYEDRAPNAGAITAQLVPEAGADPVALEEQIIADLAAFAQTMETAMQPWILQWEQDGWLGLFQSLWGNLQSGAAAWWEGEGEFWSAVGTWLSNLPDMLGDAWDSFSAGAKALWEQRDQILSLLQSLAEGAVADFEAALEALSTFLQTLPDFGELAQIVKDLVEESAEWAGAMIEVATQTRVLAVLGGTFLGMLMMIPPNFWTDMVTKGVGYLIPELLIVIVLGIISFFTAGTGGAALAARITTYTAKVTADLSKSSGAGRELIRVFALLKSLTGKMVDLIKALKGQIDDAAEGATNGVTKITRNAKNRVPPKRRSFHREDLDERWYKIDDGELDWPPNDGFQTPPKPRTLKLGDRIDRYSGSPPGQDGGKYFSPAGASFESRALPYDPATQRLSTFEVIRPFEVQSGHAAPWFDQAGGATQYMTEMSTKDLIRNGFIRPIP